MDGHMVLWCLCGGAAWLASGSPPSLTLLGTGAVAAPSRPAMAWLARDRTRFAAGCADASGPVRQAAYAGMPHMLPDDEAGTFESTT
jgi:hypothetical protein